MAYCKKCKGQYMAEVEITTKTYGQDTYTHIKTIYCPCLQVPVVQSASGTGEFTQGRIFTL